MPRKKGKQVVAQLKKESEKGLAIAKQIMREDQMHPQELQKAFEHYLEHWNDFTHAGLFSMACKAVGGNPDDNVTAQAAIAMMAAAFDIHDDILDKSAAKNKIPTVFGMCGVEITLLLGNAFLIEGFKTFADSLTTFQKEKRNYALKKIKDLFFEVGNAHSLEVCLKQKKQITPSEYMTITKLKAAAFEADLMLGAFFGGGDEAEVSTLAKLGRTLGVLGILRDDIVDVFDIEELRQRIAVQDLPLPLLFAMEDEEISVKAKTILSKPKVTSVDVSELVDLTLKATQVVEIKDKMRLLMKEAFILLHKLPKKKLQGSLQAVILFMLEDL